MRCSIKLNGICRRLDRIEALLNVPSYDLVFIGRIGIGKTTAVCRLFNLTLTEEKLIWRIGKMLFKSTEILWFFRCKYCYQLRQ
ncbi:MAG: hypothetical protein ABI417_11875, partial [Coleofasciculaceae cyanobacterium]